MSYTTAKSALYYITMRCDAHGCEAVFFGVGSIELVRAVAKEEGWAAMPYYGFDRCPDHHSWEKHGEE